MGLVRSLSQTVREQESRRQAPAQPELALVDLGVLIPRAPLCARQSTSGLRKSGRDSYYWLESIEMKSPAKFPQTTMAAMPTTIAAKATKVATPAATIIATIQN